MRLTAVGQHRQQDRGIGVGVQAVSLWRDHHEIPIPAVPFPFAGTQSHLPAQHLKGGLAGTCMLGQFPSRGQCDDGLTQQVVVAAVNGMRRPAAGGAARAVQKLVAQLR